MNISAATDCPPLYDVRNDDINSCYMFVGRDLNWYEAEAFCMSTDGHLVSIESEEEQTFITNYIRSSNGTLLIKTILIIQIKIASLPKNK